MTALLPIISLAVSMALVTTVVVGVVLYKLLPEVSYAAGFALGAVVAPPDAVAATAIGRRAGLPRRLLTILEGESLFNDATALTTLRVAVAAAGASAIGVVGQFLGASLGGAAIGAVVGVGLSLVRTQAISVVNTSLSVAAPFGVYLAAEEAHTSGVIAVVVVGLMLAHQSPRDQEPSARRAEEAIWETIRFLLEGAVFALIGLQLPHIVSGVHDPLPTVLAVCGSVLAICLLIRPLWLVMLEVAVPLLSRKRAERLPWKGILVVSWAGVRGVVSLAAAQSLPLVFPRRNLLLATVVVIVGTLGLQGITLPWVIRRAGVLPPDPRVDALQIAHAQEIAGDAALARLDELVAAEPQPQGLVDRLRRQVELRTYTGWERLGPNDSEAPSHVVSRLRREMVAAERDVFIGLRDSGQMDEEILRRVQRRLDLEESLLSRVDAESNNLQGHQEVLPAPAPDCPDLRQETRDVPIADPRECPDCVVEGRSDWVHLRICLRCRHIGCCDSSPARHADEHYRSTGHPVMGSAETGESWRWCYKHRMLG